MKLGFPPSFVLLMLLQLLLLVTIVAATKTATRRKNTEIDIIIQNYDNDNEEVDIALLPVVNNDATAGDYFQKPVVPGTSTGTTTGLVSVQNVYSNEKYEEDEKSDCDDDKFAVELDIDLDGGGSKNAVYLLKRDNNRDWSFVLSGPAMSLSNSKNYGTKTFCLGADKSQRYYLDVANVDNKGWDGNLELRVWYKGKKKTWTPDSGNWRYQWANFDSNRLRDEGGSSNF